MSEDAGPLTLTETRAALTELGHHPRQPLGQNFLIDGNVVRKSIALAELTPGQHVVEVGPGLGTLSRALLSARAKVHAVEVDRRLAERLRSVFAGANFELTEGDAVTYPLAGYTEPESFKIVANLPYAISTPWLDGVLSGPIWPERMVLMLQKEAADRYLAEPGSKAFGAIAIFLRAAFQATAVHPVAASCFYPKPAVASVLLRLDRRPEPRRYPEEVRAAIRRCFGQRRKQLGKLIRNEPSLQVWWESAKLPPTIRAESVPWEAWEQLSGVA